MQTYWFVDANGNGLPQGYVLKFPSLTNHEAIIDYTCYGEQVLLEKSKKYRMPTVTNPEEYRDIPFVISRIPTSAGHALRIVQHAYSEIEAGAPWTLFDNCQDFVSRAYKGKNGSSTRDFIFGLCALGLLVTVAVNSK
jgi:hypothetical protein